MLNKYLVNVLNIRVIYVNGLSHTNGLNFPTKLNGLLNKMGWVGLTRPIVFMNISVFCVLARLWSPCSLFTFLLTN